MLDIFSEFALIGCAVVPPVDSMAMFLIINILALIAIEIIVT